MSAEMGMTPPPSPFPITTMSGTTPNFSNVKKDPVRPSELGISSNISNAPAPNKTHQKMYMMKKSSKFRKCAL